MSKKTKIQLHDHGQDLLWFITDDKGKIIKAGPFHDKLYKGGYIPIEQQEIGQKCMIHHPPAFHYGFLKYKVESISEINLEDEKSYEFD